MCKNLYIYEMLAKLALGNINEASIKIQKEKVAAWLL